MNAKVIIYLLGKISAGLAIAQLLPLLMSVVYGEYATSRTFIFSIAVAVILAGIFDYYGDGRGARNLSARYSFRGFWLRLWEHCLIALTAF